MTTGKGDCFHHKRSSKKLLLLIFLHTITLHFYSYVIAAFYYTNYFYFYNHGDHLFDHLDITSKWGLWPRLHSQARCLVDEIETCIERMCRLVPSSDVPEIPDTHISCARGRVKIVPWLLIWCHNAFKMPLFMPSHSTYYAHFKPIMLAFCQYFFIDLYLFLGGYWFCQSYHNSIHSI